MAVKALHKKGRPLARHANLYYKKDKTTKPATAALYGVLALCLIALFLKVFVADLMLQEKRAREASEKAEAAMLAKIEQLADFDDVSLKYHRFARTDDEASIVSRIEVIEAIDRAIGASSQVRSFTVQGTTAQISFDSIPLSKVSDIVAALEKEPVVGSVTLNMAATQVEGMSTDAVGAVIVMDLAAPDGADLAEGGVSE